MINKELLDILRCPETKAPLVLENNSLVSIDKDSRRSYPIVDDVPILLIEKSTQLTVEAWAEVMKKHNISAS